MRRVGGGQICKVSDCLLTRNFCVKGLGHTKRPLVSHSADLTGCTYLHLQRMEANLEQINYLLITTNCATWKSNKTARVVYELVSYIQNNNNNNNNNNNKATSL